MLSFTIGREPTSDIILPDDTISSDHGALRLSSQGILSIKDHGSLNGTVVKLAQRSIALEKGEAAQVELNSRVQFGAVQVSVIDLIVALLQRAPSARADFLNALPILVRYLPDGGGHHGQTSDVGRKGDQNHGRANIDVQPKPDRPTPRPKPKPAPKPANNNRPKFDPKTGELKL